MINQAKLLIDCALALADKGSTTAKLRGRPGHISRNSLHSCGHQFCAD